MREEQSLPLRCGFHTGFAKYPDESVAYGAASRVSEVVALKVSDLDAPV